MNQSQLLTKASIPVWIKIIFIAFIGLGIFFRFAHLGQKFYCCDESWTSVAISGHTLTELKQELSKYQGVIPITVFNKYQHINPDRGVGDTINYLMTSDAQHPPLYYVIVRLWTQIFGDSPTGVRSLSAFISLLIFPSVYWLCLELFSSSVVGWVAMVLIAVSPLQLFFAQEARQYSLWMVAVLISSAVLLQAIKQESQKNWAIYSLILILGLYTHLFTVMVMICHGIYVIVQQKFRFTKTLLNYFLSTIAALLMLLPWVIVLINNINIVSQRTSGWSSTRMNPLELITIFLIRVVLTFFDLNLNLEETQFHSSVMTEGALYYTIPALIFSLVFLIYLIFFIVKTLPNTNNLLIYLLAIFPSAVLIMYDVICGGIRSIQTRYQLPLYISIEIIVAYILSVHIFQEKTWQKTIGGFIIIALLILGLVSDVRFSLTKTWWIQGGNFIIETSELLNQSKRPLLAINDSDINLGSVLTLTHLLPKLNLLLVTNEHLWSIIQNYNLISLTDNNSSLFHQLEQDKNYALKAIKVLNLSTGGLWQFEKVLDKPCLTNPE